MSSERLAYVQLNAANKSESLLNLNDETLLFIKKGSFKVIAPPKQQVMAEDQRRWGGGKQVAETHENGAIEWEAGVAGKTEQECLEKIEAMLARLEANPYQTFIEWQTPAAAHPTLYETRATGVWSCSYTWEEFSGALLCMFTVHVQVAPLAQALPIVVLNQSGANLPATFPLSIPGDAPAKAEVTIETGEGPEFPWIEAAAAHTIAVSATFIYFANPIGYIGRAKINGSGVEKEWLHVEGEPYGVAIDGTFVYWTDQAGNAIGRAKLAGTSVEKTWITGAGAPNELAVTSTHVYWTRPAANRIGRAAIAGGSVEKEWVNTTVAPTGIAVAGEYVYFSSALGQSIGRVSLAGGELFTKLIVVTGAPSAIAISGPYLYWCNHSAGTVGRAFTGGFEVQQAWMAGASTPTGIALDSEFLYFGELFGIGRTPIAPSPPIFALLGWAAVAPGPPALGLAYTPFGSIGPGGGQEAVGWESRAAAGAVGGEEWGGTVTNGSVGWEIDPATMVPDSFSGELAVEIWARVLLTPSLVLPRMTLSAQPQDGIGYGTPRYTDEWGSAGRPLTLPAAGPAVYRLTRLGTLHLLVNQLAPRIWVLTVSGVSEVAANWGVNYLLAVSSTQRACSPSGKPNGPSYPPFIANIGPTIKTIHSDLSAMIAKGPRLTLTGTLTKGSAEVTAISSTAALEAGMPVEGTHIPAGTRIKEVKSAKIIVLTAAATAAETFAVLVFSKYGHPDHGLGGQLLEIPPGESQLLVKLSNLVPDDPTVTVASEQKSHGALVTVTVTPRFFLTRTT